MFDKLYNPQPLIYADFTHEQIGNQLKQVLEHNKFKEESDLANPTVDWSDRFVFEVPNISSIVTPTSTQAAWVMRLINISLQRSTAVGIPLPASVITKDHFMDNTFGPLESLPTFTGSINTQWIASFRKKFIISAEFAGMYQVTTAIDSQNVGYYISRLEVYSPPNSFPIGVGVSDAVSMSGGSSMEDKAMKPFEEYQSYEFNYNIFKKTLVNSGFETEVLAVEPNNKIGKVVIPGGIGSLLITKSQHSSMLSLASGMNADLHDILLQYQTIPPITATRDDNDQLQYNITLQLVGIDNSGIYTPVSAGISVKGATPYNLRSDAAAINANIDRKENVKTYSEIQLAVDEVSNKYQIELGADANAAETVTRINAHHFGYPGKGLQAPAFMKASRNSPYFESVIGNSCSTVGLPVSGYLIIYPPLGCRLKDLNEKELSQASFKCITAEELIMLHNNLPIDFGHAFVGLNFLLHENRNAAPDTFLQNIGINHGLDLTSFIGDIASALAEAYKESNSPSNALIDDKYSKNFPQKDLYGDIDAFGLKTAYTEVIANNTNAKFSEVYSHYYSSIVPTNQNSHYTKRFTNFATEWDLIDSQGVWQGQSFPHYNDWVQRIKDIFPFLYLSLYDIDERSNIGINLWFDTDVRDVDLTEAPSLNHNDVIYAIDKFLSSIQTGQSNE